MPASVFPAAMVPQRLMTTISRSALVMYTPNQMYDLVNDVEAYPLFLPWCSGVDVVEKCIDRQTASICISRAAVNQRFTTRNTMQANQRIDMVLLDGPFSHLNGSWVFTALGDVGCKVLLDIEFAIANPLIATSVGPVFGSICGSLVEAFCQRAKEVYV